MIYVSTFPHHWRNCLELPFDLSLNLATYTNRSKCVHCKKAARNSDVDNGGANQTTWRSENSYFHVLWFCATVVNIGIWRIPTWLFFTVWTFALLSKSVFQLSTQILDCGENWRISRDKADQKLSVSVTSYSKIEN
jgi:hypothetical protein